MPLPVAFLSTISAGVNALRGEETRLRRLSCNGDPRLLLALRDVGGLRERLESESRENWERGWAWAAFAPQDLAVLEELAQRSDESPYQDAAGRAFRELRDCLDWYSVYHFDLDAESGAA